MIIILKDWHFYIRIFSSFRHVRFCVISKKIIAFLN